MAERNMIRAEALTKVFDQRCVVDRLGLEVAAGEIVALLGPNGAGKTTSVRMLAGILRPTAGRAWIAGFDITTEAESVREVVGVLTEHHGLYTRMRAGEYLDFFGALYGLPARVRHERTQRLMQTLALQVDSDRWLAEYSKGMRQRISLVRALLHEPPVLMLDEPTSALDPESAHLVRGLLRDLRGQGRAILACTHNLGEAEELADRIAILRQGSLVAQGRPEQLRAQLGGAPLFELHHGRPGADLASLLDGLVTLEGVGSNWVRFRAQAPAEQNPLVVRRMVEQGIPVIEMRELTPSLESVYLRAVAQGGSLGGEGGGGAEA